MDRGLKRQILLCVGRVIGKGISPTVTCNAFSDVLLSDYSKKYNKDNNACV